MTDVTDRPAVTASRRPNGALRRARLARGWTIERMIQELDAVNGRPTGLAVSTISGWEIGRTRAVLTNQELLSRLFGCPRSALGFDGPALAPEVPQRVHVVTNYADLLDAMTEVVESAHEHLAITGSRSREASYLEHIERVVTARPNLTHWRVLFGPLRHPLIRSHLLRLSALDRDNVHIGIVPDVLQQPERFMVVSESRAVMVLPSPVAVDHFDSGLVTADATLSLGWVKHVRHAYMSSQDLDTAGIADLPVVR